MARKMSLDEHWLNAPTLTPEQTARVAAAANDAQTLREKALAWAHENAARLTVTAESEDGESAVDIAALEAALEEADGNTLTAWLKNPESVSLNGGWGRSDSLLHVCLTAVGNV